MKNWIHSNSDEQIDEREPLQDKTSPKGRIDNNAMKRLVCLGALLLMVFLSMQRVHRQPYVYVPPESSEKATLVLMGYSVDRLENYDIVLPAYQDMDDVLDQVLLLWNNLDEEPPALPPPGKVPIVLLRQEENSMNNRFGPDVSSRTKTDAVLLVDDDVLLTEKMIRRMMNHWVESSSDPLQRRLVGIQGDGRYASREDGYLFPCTRWEGWFMQSQCWTSDVMTEQHRLHQNNLNVLIGKTMLLSKQFLELYQSSRDVWQYTSPQGGHFCEDIMMNALIRSTQDRKSNPLLVSKRLPSGLRSGDNRRSRTILKEKGGLSFSPKVMSWTQKRSECVRWATTYFGEDIWEST